MAEDKKAEGKSPLGLGPLGPRSSDSPLSLSSAPVEVSAPHNTDTLDTETVLSNAELSRYGYRMPPEQSERPSEKTTVADPHSADTFTAKFLDGAGLGFLFIPPEILVLEATLGSGPINWTLVLASFFGCYIVGGMLLAAGLKWPKIKPKLRSGLALSVDRTANSSPVWFALIAMLAFGPPIIVAWSSHSSSQPQLLSQQNGFQIPPPPPKLSIPRKNYSATEKRTLLELIGSISTLLNDKGLRAATIGHGSSNSVPTTKNDLDQLFSAAEQVQASLNSIESGVWGNILANNPNFSSDLTFVIDNNIALDQFQRATGRFEGQIINFSRNVDSLNQDERNWVASLIGWGPAQDWQRAADNFRDWIQQCNARIDAEREGLK